MEEEKRPGNSRTIVFALISLLVFILILILFLYLIRSPALFGSFAQSENTTSILNSPQSNSSTTVSGVSFENSYLFASPLRASVGAERIRITAYILDGQGIGISGKEVVLVGSVSSIHIYPISPVTDASGRATFDVSGDSVGNFVIEASVGGKKLNQNVSISFN